MRSSTLIVAILFGLAIGWLLAGRFIEPVVNQAATFVGENRAGKAIIPPHLNEKEIRERVRHMNQADSRRELSVIP